MENRIDWKEKWEQQADTYSERYHDVPDKEIIVRIQALNDPYSPEWVALWNVLAGRKDTSTGHRLIQLLATYDQKNEFLKRVHCLKAIFKIFDIENMPLQHLISGPSNDFNENYFRLGMKTLESLIAE